MKKAASAFRAKPLMEDRDKEAAAEQPVHA
jgi:hypothetical protein